MVSKYFVDVFCSLDTIIHLDNGLEVRQVAKTLNLYTQQKTVDILKDKTILCHAKQVYYWFYDTSLIYVSLNILGC